MKQLLVYLLVAIATRPGYEPVLWQMYITDRGSGAMSRPKPL